jgi:hypothetical protein
MKDRLRSSIRTFGVFATLVFALSLAGVGMSQARPPVASPSARVNQAPCKALCKAYTTWSHRVTAMFRPSRPLKPKTAAAHRGQPARAMLAHHAPGYARHAPGTRRPGLNSFAQWPAQSDAAPAETRQAGEPTPAAEAPRAAATPPATETPQAAAMAQAEATPFRPIDQIADRFPTVREFMTAQRADADSPANGPADGPTFAVTGPVPHDASASDADIRLIAALLIALSTLPTLRFFKQVDRLARRRLPARAAVEA